MQNRKRTTRVPYQSFRHPLTGAHVVVPEDKDTELMCLRLSGQYDDMLDRMAELSGQSSQNRRRIQRRIGLDGEGSE
jgi:hypothetical protein